jgi:glycosyltransferase involved in cell wall biosynthesis
MAIIDVVVPCYKYGHFLAGCVESILNQSIKDVRVLIIDDASPDESAVVARDLARQDARIQVEVHKENRGHIATYNEGIEWASAPYFLILSADDLLAPGALKRAVDILNRRDDVVLTYGGCIELWPGQPLPLMDDKYLDAQWHVRPGLDYVQETCIKLSNLVPTPTAIARTSVQKRIGGYRPALWHAGDMEMWLRFAAHGSVAKTSVVQGFYRKHGNNMSTPVYKKVVENYVQQKQVFDVFFTGDGAILPGAARLHQQTKRRLGEAAFWTGVSQCCRGNVKVGLEVLKFAWSQNPDTRLFPPIGHLLQKDHFQQKLWSVLSDIYRKASARLPSGR